MTDPIRVLLVDDDALVRAGLSMLLAGADDVRVEGRQDDDLRRVLALAQELGGGKAVHPRHPNVHQHDVRLMLGDCGGDLAPV